MRAFVDAPLEYKIAALVSILVCFYARRWWSQRGSDLSRVKRAPNPHWFWGHEKDAWALTDSQFYIKNVNELGQAFVMTAGLFHADILAITDPAAISHIYSRRPYFYLKSQIIRPLVGRLLGKSLIWAEGEQHKQQRQMLAPVFTHENVKRMGEEIHRASDKLVEVLREHIQDQSDATVTPPMAKVNILDWACAATLDIIGIVGFGYDFQCGKNPEAKAIQASWRRLVEMGLELPAFAAPLVLRAFPFIPRLPLKSIQAQGEIKSTVKRLAGEIVSNRRLLGGDAAEKGGKDLLSTLLRMSAAQNEPLDQLLDHICTFVMVGHETTSATINFSLLELSRSKVIQDRLRQEIVEFVGSGPGGEPTYEEFQTKLPYLDAVCKETLRKYPPASHAERIAEEDDILPLRFPITSNTGEQMNSIKIKKGQVIAVPVMAINRNVEVWGPDAETFRPERWLEPGQLPPASDLTQGWSGIFSFIEGPRICIGYRLALFEFKVIMSALLKNFEFIDSGAKIVTQFSSTLQPYVEGEKEFGVQIPMYVKELL